jgi:hypothetical protein
MSVSDSEQLHNRTMTITVKVKPGDGQYGPSNEIGAYEPPANASVAAPAFRPPQAQSGLARDVAAAEAVAPKAATAPATPPWRRTA